MNDEILAEEMNRVLEKHEPTPMKIGATAFMVEEAARLEEEEAATRVANSSHRIDIGELLWSIKTAYDGTGNANPNKTLWLTAANVIIALFEQNQRMLAEQAASPAVPPPLISLS